MKFTLIFISIRKNQLSDTEIEHAKKIVANSYTDIFNMSSDNLEVNVEEGKGKNVDFALAYDQAPSVPNAISKLNLMVERVGATLKSILPKELCFGGIGTYMPLANVKFPPAANSDGTESNGQQGNENEFEILAKQYTAEEAKYTFERVILEDSVKRAIDEALAVLRHRELLFERWGLKSIMSPSALLNLYGSSGTGKTMTAEAIANELGKKIIRATYADIESKWHGEGPQKLKAIFMAAKEQDAVLFIDEADSMLSARLTGVSSGSEQAINSMRSQLLICLENFDGVVIFATNLIQNYDPAFLTRLICIELKRPDAAARERIWTSHLYPMGESENTLNIPSSGDWNLKELAEKYDFCGRDIRNSVKKACATAVLNAEKNKIPETEIVVSQKDLIYACEYVKDENKRLEEATGKVAKVKMVTPEEREKYAKQAAEALIEKSNSEN